MAQQKKTEKMFWNFYAFCYDAISHLIPYQEMMADVTEAIDLKPGERLLDAGCGTGNLELAIWKDFQKKYPGQKVRIDAVDFSESMLSRAIKKCENIHEVSFRWMDLNEPLPYPDGIFDKIACINTLYALDVNKVISEFNRILKPYGKIIVVNPILGFDKMKIFRKHLSNLGCRKRFLLLDILDILVHFPKIFYGGLLNILIDKKEKEGYLYILDKQKLIEQLNLIFKVLGDRFTYAEQAILLVAERRV